MIEFMESLPTIVSGAIIVFGFVVLALIFGYVVSKIAPREIRIEHNELAGFILAVIGVIYAVLLAFVTIGVWERFQQAETRTYEEAAALTQVYRDAALFPNAGELRAALHTYVEGILNDEWPRMQQGGESPRVNTELERIEQMVQDLPVTSPSRQDAHQQMLASMYVALGDRDARLSEDATGIPSIMWVVLAAGAAVTIGFSTLFGFRSARMQIAMIGSEAFLIGLVLFLAIALNYPYRGSITVEPKAFESALRTFTELSH